MTTRPHIPAVEPDVAPPTPEPRGARAEIFGLAAFLLLFAALVGYQAYADSPLGNTAYAPGFDQAAFRDLKPGATREEVRRDVGEPLDSWTSDSSERWSYSKALDNRGSHRIHVTATFDAKSGLLLESTEQAGWDPFD